MDISLLNLAKTLEEKNQWKRNLLPDDHDCLKAALQSPALWHYLLNPHETQALLNKCDNCIRLSFLVRKILFEQLACGTTLLEQTIPKAHVAAAPHTAPSKQLLTDDNYDIDDAEIDELIRKDGDSIATGDTSWVLGAYHTLELDAEDFELYKKGFDFSDQGRADSLSAMEEGEEEVLSGGCVGSGGGIVGVGSLPSCWSTQGLSLDGASEMQIQLAGGCQSEGHRGVLGNLSDRDKDRKDCLEHEDTASNFTEELAADTDDVSAATKTKRGKNRELQMLLPDVKPKQRRWTQILGPRHSELLQALEMVLEKLKADEKNSVHFLNKVRKCDAPDYYSIISEPMYLALMTKKLRACMYHSKADFSRDLHLIFTNCRKYNSPDSIYCKAAQALEETARSLMSLVPDITVTQDDLPSSASPRASPVPAAMDSVGLTSAGSGVGLGLGLGIGGLASGDLILSLSSASVGAIPTVVSAADKNDTAPPESQAPEPHGHRDEDLEQPAQPTSAEMAASVPCLCAIVGRPRKSSSHRRMGGSPRLLADEHEAAWRSTPLHIRLARQEELKKASSISWTEREALLRTPESLAAFISKSSGESWPAAPGPDPGPNRDTLSPWPPPAFGASSADTFAAPLTEISVAARLSQPQPPADLVGSFFCPEMSPVSDSVPDLLQPPPPPPPDPQPRTLLRVNVVSDNIDMANRIRDYKLRLAAIQGKEPSEMPSGSILTTPLSKTLSRSPCTAPVHLDPSTAWKVLRQSTALLLAHAGYEGTKEAALHVLTDIASAYLLKIGKVTRTWLDAHSATGTPGELVEQSISAMGEDGASSVRTYYGEKVLSISNRLHIIERGFARKVLEFGGTQHGISVPVDVGDRSSMVDGDAQDNDEDDLRNAPLGFLSGGFEDEDGNIYDLDLLGLQELGLGNVHVPGSLLATGLPRSNRRRRPANSKFTPRKKTDASDLADGPAPSSSNLDGDDADGDAQMRNDTAQMESSAGPLSPPSQPSSPLQEPAAPAPKKVKKVPKRTSDGDAPAKKPRGKGKQKVKADPDPDYDGD